MTIDFRELDEFGELMDTFDPKRVLLTPEGFNADEGTEIRVSVESGQPAGCFSDPKDGLLHMMRWAKWAGAEFLMPCEPVLRAADHSATRVSYRSVAELREIEEKSGLKFGVPSFHVLNYCRLTVGWPGDPENGFPSGVELCGALLPSDVLALPVKQIETWIDDCLIALIDQTVERGYRVAATFDGLWANPALHGGHPWPFGVDGLILRGLERYERETRRVREHAVSCGFVLGRELHQMSGHACPDELAALLIATDYCPSIGVWDDPSHTDERGETASQRINHPVVKGRVVGGHTKNFGLFEGNGPSRKMDPRWNKRHKRFVGHDEGVVDLVRHTTEVMATDAGRRFKALTGQHLQLGSEAEHWNQLLVTPSEVAFATGELTDPAKVKPGASARGIRWCLEHLRHLEDSTVPFDKLMERAAKKADD